MEKHLLEEKSLIRAWKGAQGDLSEGAVRANGYLPGGLFPDGKARDQAQEGFKKIAEALGLPRTTRGIAATHPPPFSNQRTNGFFLPATRRYFSFGYPRAITA